MEIFKEKLEKDLSLNAVNIRNLLDNTEDLIIKYAKIGGHSSAVILCEGMTSTDTIANMIFRPLNSIKQNQNISAEKMMEIIRDDIFLASSQLKVNTYKELSRFIMSGFLVILIDGVDYGIALGVQGFKSRGVEQASTHQNIRASRESFNETIRVNMTLLRRRIKSPTLVFKMMTLGDRSNTDVCLCYFSDKINPDLLKGVTEKLEKINLNTILEGGYIQPFLESEKNLIFSEVGVTERPDTLAAKLYDGRVGIIVDGTPFALYLPHLLTEDFQTMDDYTGTPYYAGFIRVLKYFAFILTMTLPGFYLAVANFNPELIPNTMLFNLLVSVQATPFPLIAECIIIHVMYEILREAGIRLPSNTGHVVSIVGGLVIGDIVVSAGLIGAPMVLIIAISAIVSFIIPDLYSSVVIIRFGFIFAGGFFGLFGMTVFGVIIMIKMFSMSDFGVPFTSPIVPFSLKGARDTIARLSWKTIGETDVPLDKMNGVRVTEKGGNK